MSCKTFENALKSGEQQSWSIDEWKSQLPAFLTYWIWLIEYDFSRTFEQLGFEINRKRLCGKQMEKNCVVNFLRKVSKKGSVLTHRCYHWLIHYLNDLSLNPQLNVIYSSCMFQIEKPSFDLHVTSWNINFKVFNFFWWTISNFCGNAVIANTQIEFLLYRVLIYNSRIAIIPFLPNY